MPSVNHSMDDTDRELLNRIQSDFPLCARPYQAIAKDMNLTEKDVIKRLAKLRASGIIRRIGGNFTPNKLGYVSTLCAARVPENKIDLFARTVNRYPGVTHNYLRHHDYNIWFTFISPSKEDIENNLTQISNETGITNILNMPATKVFKIKAHFDL